MIKGNIYSVENESNERNVKISTENFTIVLSNSDKQYLINILNGTAITTEQVITYS